MKNEEFIEIISEWSDYRNILEDKLLSQQIDTDKYRFYEDKLTQWEYTLNGVETSE